MTLENSADCSVNSADLESIFELLPYTWQANWHSTPAPARSNPPLQSPTFVCASCIVTNSLSPCAPSPQFNKACLPTSSSACKIIFSRATSYNSRWLRDQPTSTTRRRFMVCSYSLQMTNVMLIFFAVPGLRYPVDIHYTHSQRPITCMQPSPLSSRSIQHSPKATSLCSLPCVTDPCCCIVHILTLLQGITSLSLSTFKKTAPCVMF
jgi:hypothetical protein